MNWIKLVGLLFDIVGTILIAVAVVNFHSHLQAINSGEELKSKIDEEIRRESMLTVVGIVLVVIGFMLMFFEEIYRSYNK